eukprot:TRINITY_DN4511_c1_g1_i1.p1 TRINITY_DN4511_c1_g1~~TRINITY_DN4511_c1_g1_i1.p1  ORF type:complete len:101 (+),score=2.78 TRINITY_DN4511_c1_g1_i1:174-476(+)
MKSVFEGPVLPDKQGKQSFWSLIKNRNNPKFWTPEFDRYIKENKAKKYKSLYGKYNKSQIAWKRFGRPLFLTTITFAIVYMKCETKNPGSFKSFFGFGNK